MPNRYRTMLLFGPPGVGKGTQGKILGCIPGLHHLATGDVFRALDRDSDLGREFHRYSSRGELVPDHVTIAVWQDYVHSLIDKGAFSPASDLLILDGIPRSIPQAQALDPHIEVLAIVHLRCTDLDEMVGRMKRRAHMENRHDDANETVIRRRFEVYEGETAPVLSHYPPDLIAEVDALGTPADVLRRILEVIAPIYNRHFGNPLAPPPSTPGRRSTGGSSAESAGKTLGVET